jgi:hypothetical protein
MGLREQIKNATSDTEVTQLLATGKSYEFASDRTQSSWRSTATFRLAELSNPTPTQTPNKPTESKKGKKPKKSA